MVADEDAEVGELLHGLHGLPDDLPAQRRPRRKKRRRRAAGAGAKGPRRGPKAVAVGAGSAPGLRAGLGPSGAARAVLDPSDPDDLPKRARWTIAVTACLLLVMSMLLVGITLRMAPIIDEMVRKENEEHMNMLNRASQGFNVNASASASGGGGAS